MVDPTFGYETIGTSSTSFENKITGSVFTITEDGTADSITVAVQMANYGGPYTVKCAIYKHSDLSLVKSTEERSLAKGTDGWETFNFESPKPSLTADTEYILVGWTVSGLVYFNRMYYSAGDTDQGHYDDETYNSFPDPLVPNHTPYKFSIYCTYTTGGATYTKTWQSDVLFKKLGITKTAPMDVAFKKLDITATAAIDAFFKKIIEKTFGLDSAFLKSVIKQKPVDALFKKLGITETFTIDSLLKKQDIQIQKQVDLLFKKLNILKTFGVDVELLKKNIIKSFAIDATFGAVTTYTIQKNIDALFKKLGITKTFSLDADFQKTQQVQRQIDAFFQKTVTLSKQINVLFKKLAILKTFNIDVAIQRTDIPTTLNIDALLKSTLLLTKQVDVLFKKHSILKGFGVDACFGVFVERYIPFEIMLGLEHSTIDLVLSHATIDLSLQTPYTIELEVD